MNNQKPFLALPYKAKIYKNIDNKLFQNIHNKEILYKTIKINENVMAVNSLQPNYFNNNESKNIDLKDNDFKNKDIINENSNLISDEFEIKYCCYDIQSYLYFIKKCFLSSNLLVNKNEKN